MFSKRFIWLKFAGAKGMTPILIIALLAGFGQGHSEMVSANDRGNLSASEEVRSKHRKIQRKGNLPQNQMVVNPQKDAQRELSVHALIAFVRSIHPIVLALAQVLIVIGVCLVLTDNKELELYFKIEYQPPEVDILN